MQSKESNDVPLTPTQDIPVAVTSPPRPGTPTPEAAAAVSSLSSSPALEVGTPMFSATSPTTASASSPAPRLTPSPTLAAASSASPPSSSGAMVTDAPPATPSRQAARGDRLRVFADSDVHARGKATMEATGGAERFFSAGSGGVGVVGPHHHSSSSSSALPGPFSAPARRPLPLRAGGILASPVAMCELTPVIRNTCDDDNNDDDYDYDEHGSFFHPPPSSSAMSDADKAKRREKFLSLSVPASMGRSSDGSGGLGEGGQPGHLQQRPLRPFPPVSCVGGVGASAAAAAASASTPRGPMLRLEVPIPPRASGAAPHRAPYLRMDDDSPPLGPRGDAPPHMGSISMPPLPVAVRSNSAGNLDMHSIVLTIREHLARQREESGDDGYGTGDDGGFFERNVGKDCDAEAAAGLSSPARQRDWTTTTYQDSPARSLQAITHRPIARRGREDEITLQVGLPPPSILHPSLPRHPDTSRDILREPYCPIRENSFEVGVRRVDRNELESIFNQRGPTSHVRNDVTLEDGKDNDKTGGGGGRPPLCAPGDSSASSSFQFRSSSLRHSFPHPNLQPVPLAERDWSIPSLHLANPMRGSSVSYASYTCSEDDYTEEDNIIYRDERYDDEEGEYDENNNVVDDDDDDDEATVSTLGSLDESGNHRQLRRHPDRGNRAPPTTSVDDDDDVAQQLAGALSLAPSLANHLPPPFSGEVVIEAGVLGAATELTSSSSASLSSASARRGLPFRKDVIAEATSEFVPKVNDSADEAEERQAENEEEKEKEGGEDGEEGADPRLPSPPTVRYGEEENIRTPRQATRRHRDQQRRKKNETSGGRHGRGRARSAEKERQENAIAWLKTVEVGGISEAASSKFLTAGPTCRRAANTSSPNSVMQPHPMNRVISSPAACFSKGKVV